MAKYPAITSDKELLTAILYIYRDGRYEKWYKSFGSDFYDIVNQNILIVACDKSYDEIRKLDFKIKDGILVDKDGNEFQELGNADKPGTGPWTYLEVLGSNLVTDAMDEYQGQSDSYKWEEMPQVEIINAMDAYIHHNNKEDENAKREDGMTDKEFFDQKPDDYESN